MQISGAQIHYFQKMHFSQKFEIGYLYDLHQYEQGT